MEKRDKKARLDSLSELRRLRQEGGSRLDSLKKDEEETDIVPSEYFNEDEAFIEHDERLPKRPAVFSFRPKNMATTHPIRDNKVDKRTLEEDDYFKSLISKMDDEITSSEDEDDDDDGEGKNPASQINPLGSNLPLSSQLPPATDPLLSSEFVPIEGQYDVQIEDGDLIGGMDWLDEDFQMDIGPASLSISQNQTESEIYTNPLPDDPNDFMAEIAPLNNNIYENIKDEVIKTSITDGKPVNFYYLDAFERSNGNIYLFGKVLVQDQYVSCCVSVLNMKRNLFFLPREYLLGEGDEITEDEVTLKDVHQEISSLASTYRINKFACKKVTRKYGFEIPDIPVEADYIKMVYPYDSPSLPKNIKGKSFSHVFGIGTSALETFLVKRRIMGPCWLTFTPTSTVKRSVSWCKIEMEVSDPKTIQPVINAPDAPRLTVLSLSLRTVVHPESKSHEIVAASGLVYNSINFDGTSSSLSNNAEGDDKPKCNAAFSVLREIENIGFTSKFTDQIIKSFGMGKIELAKNERALLSYLITMIYRSDPDVIIGHNFLGFDLGVLLHRMRACKVDFWSRLGRLCWSQWPKAKPGSTEASYAEKQIVSGRLICDTYLCSKDLVRCKNYSLQTLVETQLQQAREPFDYERIPDCYSSPDSLVHLVRHAEKDAYFQAMLMFQLMILPLTKQLTNIAGNLWSRTLMGGRAERNEFLLLHEFHNQKFICPDKVNAFETARLSSLVDEEQDLNNLPSAAAGDKGSTKRKPTYAGGLVLEPKKGLYDSIVLLLDFNSLYPSIIQEFNICFTTIERDYSSIEASEKLPSVPESGTEQGILPKILANLVSRRRQIKSLMKDPKLTPSALAQLHIRQQALKLTANSMYGCLGFSHSRFYAKPLAMLITGKGREILQNTVDLAQSQCKLDVIYGDTDSVMIHTATRDLTEARKMGFVLKKAVNEKYRLLEIELDGIFEKLLLLKKKKYAAVILEEKSDGTIKRKIETKGLDLVRRDWCALSVDTSNMVLEKILASNLGKEEVVDGIHQILKEVFTNVSSDKVSLEKYIISKNLTKEPDQYNDIKSQPHVMVALRMKERGLAVRSGDTIPYIICGNARKEGSLAEHAFHPDEVKKDDLSIDKEWYLAQQVHPCVARLCEHLEGTDQVRIASCLGLDSSKYNTRPSNTTAHEEDPVRLSAFLTDEEKFKNVKPLRLSCPSCSNSSVFSGIASLDCSNCRQRIPTISLYYQLQSAIRHDIDEYYLGWMECDDSTCRARTRQMRVYDTRCTNDNCRGTMKTCYSGGHLYNQLLYYRSLVDVEKLNKIRSPDLGVLGKSLMTELEAVKMLVTRQLSKCSFPVVNLGEIFSFVTIHN